MTRKTRLRTFLDDEQGAVTVDWVVLTAAIVGLAIAVVAGVRVAIDDAGGRIADGMEDIDLGP